MPDEFPGKALPQGNAPNKAEKGARKLLDHIAQSIRARRLLRRGQSLLVAVSGGVDSMVLLDLLRRLARANQWQLRVAHLNHQLRGRSSDADERLVRRTAKRLRLPAVIEKADVGEFARQHKLSREMAAREVRHGFLARTARRLGLSTVVVAHHADDQLELFFLRMLRGSGSQGLAGMNWRNPSPSDSRIELVRPLLDQSKSALREYAMTAGVAFREDATNERLDIQRNRIRHELLPLLRRHYQPALAKTVLRTMEITGAEAALVTQMAETWLAGESKVQSPKSKAQSREAAAGPRHSGASARKLAGMATLCGDAAAKIPFDELPVAVQRRCVQVQLERLGAVTDFDLVEQLRMNAQRPVSVSMTGRTASAAPRLGVRDASGVVQLRESGESLFDPASIEVALQGRAGELAFAGARIRWRISEGRLRPTVGLAGREVFDADRVGARVVLRHWRAGDRFQPIGMAKTVKLQDLFTNEKVLRERRHRLIVASTGKGDVFWVEGMRISERFKLTKRTKRRLQWRWQRP